VNKTITYILNNNTSTVAYTQIMYVIVNKSDLNNTKPHNYKPRE